MVSINTDIAFYADGDKICLPIMEVLFCAAACNLARLKKQQDWMPRNAVLLLPFLMEAAILNGKPDTGDLLKIFARSITEWAKEGEDASGEDDNDDDKSKGSIEAKERKTTKKGKAKQATTEMLVTITDDCEDVLAFLQAVRVKSPRVTAASLSLCAEKRTRVWFRRWTDTNLPTPTYPDPQDHMGLTGILTIVSTMLHTTEALLPVVVTQREAKNETKGWDRPPPTAQCVILVARATNGTSIPTLPPPTIHLFLKARNETDLHEDCYLTYTGHNL